LFLHFLIPQGNPFATPPEAAFKDPYSRVSEECQTKEGCLRYSYYLLDFSATTSIWADMLALACFTILSVKYTSAAYASGTKITTKDDLSNEYHELDPTDPLKRHCASVDALCKQLKEMSPTYRLTRGLRVCLCSTFHMLVAAVVCILAMTRMSIVTSAYVVATVLLFWHAHRFTRDEGRAFEFWQVPPIFKFLLVLGLLDIGVILALQAPSMASVFD